MGTISSYTEKTTPVDADLTVISDSAATNAVKKLSWSNIKSTLKTYFDSLYLGTQPTTIELGHASDTTLARVSAGVISVEGVTIPSISSTNTFTNKRITPRILTAGSYTTDTGSYLDCDTLDMFIVTAQAGALKFNNPSGTPVHGQKLIIRIKDDGTARALTYDTQFRAIVSLPSTTVVSKTLYLGLIFNSSETKWDCVATSQEA